MALSMVIAVAGLADVPGIPSQMLNGNTAAHCARVTSVRCARKPNGSLETAPGAVMSGSRFCRPRHDVPGGIHAQPSGTHAQPAPMQPT